MIFIGRVEEGLMENSKYYQNSKILLVFEYWTPERVYCLDLWSESAECCCSLLAVNLEGGEIWLCREY